MSQACPVCGGPVPDRTGLPRTPLAMVLQVLPPSGVAGPGRR